MRVESFYFLLLFIYTFYEILYNEEMRRIDTVTTHKLSRYRERRIPQNE